MGLACIPKLGYDDVQKNIFKQNAFKIRLSVGISRSKKKKLFLIAMIVVCSFAAIFCRHPDLIH